MRCATVERGFVWIVRRDGGAYSSVSIQLLTTLSEASTNVQRSNAYTYIKLIRQISPKTAHTQLHPDFIAIDCALVHTN